MDPGFGARLRAQRERQQVTLNAISDETKIKISLLEALERDDVSGWPEGIFRRAYVRAYARAIGLEPEATVREFLAVHPDPIVVQPEDGTELENPQWPAGFRRVVTSAMAAVPTRRRRVDARVVEPVQHEEPVAQPGESVPLDPPPPIAVPEPRRELSLAAAADLCTRLGQARDAGDLAPILRDTIEALDAVGLIVWSWDSRAAALRPSLASGYTDAMLAQMPAVREDEDNAIAAAFGTGRPCIVTGGAAMTGAVAVPLLGHRGPVGVLAIELRHGDEGRESVRAFAALLAAQLVTLVGSTPLAEAVSA